MGALEGDAKLLHPAQEDGDHGETMALAS